MFGPKMNDTNYIQTWVLKKYFCSFYFGKISKCWFLLFLLFQLFKESIHNGWKYSKTHLVLQAFQSFRAVRRTQK